MTFEGPDEHLEGAASCLKVGHMEVCSPAGQACQPMWLLAPVWRAARSRIGLLTCLTMHAREARLYLIVFLAPGLYQLCSLLLRRNYDLASAGRVLYLNSQAAIGTATVCIPTIGSWNNFQEHSCREGLSLHHRCTN